MNKLMKYVEDSERNIWRVKFGEGFADFIPSSFDDLGLHPDYIQYNKKIDDYIREKGVIGLEYRSDLNRWTFSPVVNDL